MVNATGIKSFQELKEAEELLEGIFHQQVIKVRIDNTFYWGLRTDSNGLESTVTPCYLETADLIVKPSSDMEPV